MINDVADERQHVRASGNDKNVRQIIGLNRQRHAALRRGRGVRHAAVLERPQARDLRAQALGARHRRTFREDALQQRQHLRRAGVLEPEEFYVRHETLDGLVDVRDQLEREVHRLDLAAENHGVGPGVHGHVQGIHQRLALRPGRLRIRTGRAGAQQPALREDGRERLRDGGGVRKLEHHYLHHDVLGHRHRVHHGDDGSQRLQIVRRGSQQQPVRTALPCDGIGGDLDRLRQIEQHRLARVVLNLQTADLFLQLPRLDRQFPLRAGLEHVLQDRRKLGRVRLLQAHDQHLGFNVSARRIELANHLLDLRQHRVARDDKQSSGALVQRHGQRFAGADEVELRHHLLDERKDFLRRRIGQRHQAELDLSGLSGGVELRDERFEQGIIRRSRADDDAARARLGHHRDARLRRARLWRLAGLRGHRHRFLLEQFVQRACDDHRIGILEREEPELRFVPPEVERQIRDDAIQMIQLLSRAGHDQRVGLLVHGDDDFGRRVGGWNDLRSDSGICRSCRSCLRSGCGRRRIGR